MSGSQVNSGLGNPNNMQYTQALMAEDNNHIYSVKNLMKSFKKFVNETVDVYPIDSLPEDLNNIQIKDM